MKKNKRSKGLGDDIAKVTHALGLDVVADKVAKSLGFDSCGCDERQKILNKLFPYKIECLTEDEYKYLKEYFDLNKTTVSFKQRNELIKIYNRIFKKNQKDTSCAGCIGNIVNNLKRVYDEY